MSDHSPLYQKIRNELLKRIGTMQPGENRFETEEQLARQFNTTRMTVREAMNSLISEGLITRWQGRGTFGHPSAAGLKMRFDLTSDFRKLIRESGGNCIIRQENIRPASPSAQMLERMPEAAGEEVLAFDWLYCDDADPLILCGVQVPMGLIKEMPEERRGTEKLSEMLKRYCEVEVTSITTWLRPETAGKDAGLFNIPESSPLLAWEEIFYDLYDRKICFNTIRFHPSKIDLSMMQHL